LKILPTTECSLNETAISLMGMKLRIDDGRTVKQSAWREREAVEPATTQSGHKSEY